MTVLKRWLLEVHAHVKKLNVVATCEDGKSSATLQFYRQKRAKFLFFPTAEDMNQKKSELTKLWLTVCTLYPQPAPSVICRWQYCEAQ